MSGCICRYLLDAETASLHKYFPAVPFYNTKTDIPTLNNGLYPFSSHELFVYLSQKLYYPTLQK